MSDIQQLTKKIMDFFEEYDWVKFHRPKELAVDIFTESGELLELFKWQTNNTPKRIAQNKEKIADEIADVTVSALELAHVLKLDMQEIIVKKMKKNRQKYPIEKARGNDVKYTEL
ncbi:MAG: MazG-like family protein [Parcubacteria group bacterium]